MNVDLALAHSPNPPGSLILLQRLAGGGSTVLLQGTDYVLTNADIDLTVPCESGDNMAAWYLFGSSGGGGGGGGGGSSSISGMTAGQVAIAANATTITSSKPRAGTDTRIVTVATVTNGDLACGDPNGGLQSGRNLPLSRERHYWG